MKPTNCISVGQWLAVWLCCTRLVHVSSFISLKAWRSLEQSLWLMIIANKELVSVTFHGDGLLMSCGAAEIPAHLLDGDLSISV